MGLLERLKTLASADAHGVVDALEDRALVLRQHVRDASEELDRKRCRMEALAAEDEDLRSEDERLRGEIEALEGDIELALSEDREELARYAIRRLLPRRPGVAAIERRLAALAEERAALAGQLAEQEAEYERLEQRVRGFLAQRDRGGAAPALSEMIVTDEDVELELLRRRTEKGGA